MVTIQSTARDVIRSKFLRLYSNDIPFILKWYPGHIQLPTLSFRGQNWLVRFVFLARLIKENGSLILHYDNDDDDKIVRWFRIIPKCSDCTISRIWKIDTV